MIYLKRNIGANHLVRLCAHEPVTNTAINGSPLKVSYIKIPLHAVHGRKRQRTPLAVDQRAVNCLEEAVQPFTAM